MNHRARLNHNNNKVDKESENNDIKRQTSAKSNPKSGVLRKCGDSIAGGGGGGGGGGSRFNRTKKVISHDYGMPISACPATTKLISRTTQPTTLTTVKSKWPERTCHLTAAHGAGGRNNGRIVINDAMPTCTHRTRQLAPPAVMNSNTSDTCQTLDIGHAPSLASAQRVVGGGLNAVATASVGGDAKRKKIKLAKAFLLPDQENKSFVYLCKPVKKVRELLTARRLKDSAEQLKLLNPVSNITLCQDEYANAYVTGKSTYTSTTEANQTAQSQEAKTGSSTHITSARICDNVRELMTSHQHAMCDPEIVTLKDVLKTDERHVELEKNDALFRDILRTQLAEIRKQESVVKSALKALEQHKPLTDADSESAPEMEHQSPRLGTPKHTSSPQSLLAQGKPPQTPRQSEPADEVCLPVPTNEELKLLVGQNEQEEQRQHAQKQQNEQIVQKRQVEQATQMDYAERNVQMDAIVSQAVCPAAGVDFEDFDAVARRQLEFELILKGIPSLQREIEMLQSIGHKLESTLRGNVNDMQNDTCVTEVDGADADGHANTFGVHVDRCSSSIYYTPFEYMPGVSQTNVQLSASATVLSSVMRKSSSPRRRCWIRNVTLVDRSQQAKIMSPVCGVLHCFGYVTEFRIEQKTLTELKNADDNQCFYIPVNEQNTELKRTSFRKLKANPNVLMQQLKPVKMDATFNLLEQDPMFFRSIISTKQKAAPSALSDWPVEPSSSECIMLVDEEAKSTVHCNNKPLPPQVQRLLNAAAGQKFKINSHNNNGSSSFQWARECKNVQTATHCTLPFIKEDEAYIIESPKIGTSVQSEAKWVTLTPSSSMSCHTAELMSSISEMTIPVSSCKKDELSVKSNQQILSKPRIAKPQFEERLSGGKAQSQSSQSPSNATLSSPHVPPITSPVRRIRRKVTPMPHGESAVEPKSQLLKTVLVGIVQITVFLLLIMAFTYPDLRC